MSVNSYLSDLASRLVLNGIEKDNISISIATIQQRLGWYFPTEVVEKKVFGSYVRGTILPRRVDEKSDVDIMIVFSNQSGYKPQTFLNKLKAFAERYYSNSEIYQSSPTVVLELHHIKFELTPAYKEYGMYYIPNGPSTWMYTDPDGFYKTLTQCNVNNASKIKPVVRLLKYWNIKRNYRDLASFAMEKEIAERMMYAYSDCVTYADYLKRALNMIKYDTNSIRVDNAITSIDTALNYEAQGLSYSALLEIEKVFPEA